MSTPLDLDGLGDDAIVYLPVRVGDLRRRSEPNALRVYSTVEAAREYGYRPRTWKEWAEAGRIAGAYRDEGGRWRLPVAGVTAHLLRLRNRNREKRGVAKGPYRKAS